MATYDIIREMYFNKLLSKRNIAKRLMVHRDTVTRAIEREDNKFGITEGKTILDIGCGPGVITRKLSEWLEKKLLK